MFHRVVTYITLALALSALTPIAADAEDVSVELNTNRDRVALNETLSLDVVIRGAGQNPDLPDVRGLSAFDIVSSGSSMNFSSFNGVAEVSMTYTFTLAPKRIGQYTIGPARFSYNGKNYTSNTIKITVTDEPPAPSISQSARQKDVFLTASVDTDNPYVGQQVVLSIKFYSAVQTLSRPTFTPPQTTDFWTDQFPQRSYYTNVGGRRFRVTEINFALFPTRTGELEIGRAHLQVEVPTRNTRRRSFGFPSIFGGGETVNLRTRPITLNVRPLPDKGRPDNFSGAVGQFSITASADQTEVEVNVPVTVTFTLQGRGNIKALPKPEIPPLNDFRTYSGVGDEQVTKNQNQMGGVKTFEEVFIPTRQGELVIPSVEYTFFDPVQGRYVTARTKEITLRVKPSSGQLAGPTPFSFPSGGRVGSEMTSIRYIKKESDGFKKSGAPLLFEPVYIGVNAAPVLALALAFVVGARRRRLQTDVAYARSKSAGRTARKRLKHAREVAKVETAGECYGEISLAILTFIADKLNVSPHGLTIDQVSERLRSAGVSSETIELCRTLIQRADYVRYSPGSITQKDIDESLKQAEEALVSLQEAKFA